MNEQLTHTRSCAALTPGEDCTCCLKERQNTQTAETMHAAWRKRAEEAEQELAELKGQRKPAEPEQDWIDRLAGQYGVKQAATLRGDVQAMKVADIWLLDIASKHWHEILAALRKEQESAKSPAKVQVKSLCYRGRKTGHLVWWGESETVGADFARFPAGDIPGEEKT